MDPDSTTTMGDGESETTEMPFQSMNAVDKTSAKLRTWAASCRGCMFATPIIFAAGSEVDLDCRIWFRRLSRGFWGCVARVQLRVSGAELFRGLIRPWGVARVVVLRSGA